MPDRGPRAARLWIINGGHADAGAAADTWVLRPDRGERFEALTHAPPSTDILTAQQAWSEHARQTGDPDSAVPDGATASLGELILPTGATGPSPRAQPGLSRRVSWGYQLVSCAPSAVGAGSSVPLCDEWIVLDATTGDQLDQLWLP